MYLPEPELSSNTHACKQVTCFKFKLFIIMNIFSNLCVSLNRDSTELSQFYPEEFSVIFCGRAGFGIQTREFISAFQIMLIFFTE